MHPPSPSSSFTSVAEFDSGNLTLTLIPGLPDDLAALILAFLPYSYHGRLKSICKSWKYFFSSRILHSIRRKHLPFSKRSHLLCIFPQDPSVSSPYIFDPQNLAWCYLPPMPCNPHVYGLCNFISVSHDSQLYVLGGSLFDTRSFPLDRPSPSSSAFRYDFVTHSWDSLPPMLSPRGSFACAAIPNSGRILVAGGGSRHTMFGAAGSRMSSVEMYDIGRNEWMALIYITGWSVYTKIVLVRDPRRAKPGGDVTLGELLKRKADEGVNVLMLVWDDRTSAELLKKDGLMGTHDQESGDYFRDTKVRYVLCPRDPDGKNSYVQGIEVATMFTHHQKTIVVDSEIPGEKSSEMRRIIGFVGGIDLCDGRYDSRDHSLFRTLKDTHHDDFHQPNFSGSSITKGGPREPWHDVHCKLEGPIAWDILYNFEQRWTKQVGNQYLFTLTELDQFITQPSPVGPLSEDRDTWNVQLFRSIDSGAVSGFPEKPEEASMAGLVTGKDKVIDRSIQDAYINAIRRAKNFIYIENQYFLGSSYGWSPSKDFKIEDIGALHLIPKELSLKIISKIKAKERFSVYIVIPMWPEGIPESGSVQAILDWQRRTMAMMYKDITSELLAMGIEADPRDYLSFFCLGNRETKKPGEYEPPEKPEPDSDYGRAQESRRFMIYVHAKMMIVDDEYIIIGSANINQRSMDGARDTEIAMGGYQPNHIVTEWPARGAIFGFRISLWLEHMSYIDDLFRHPERVECIRRVNAIADENWGLYSSPAFVQDLPRHLLRYPVAISNVGDVTALPNFPFFPDTKAPVLGTKSEYLPPILTT